LLHHAEDPLNKGWLGIPTSGKKPNYLIVSYADVKLGHGDVVAHARCRECRSADNDALAKSISSFDGGHRHAPSGVSRS